MNQNMIFNKSVRGLTLLMCFLLCSKSTFGQYQGLPNAKVTPSALKSPYSKNDNGWFDFKDDFVSNAEAFIANYRADLSLSANDSLLLMYSNTDKYGIYKYFQHYYKGIKVAGSEYMFVEKDGKITHAHGNIVKSLNIKTLEDVNVETLLSVAISELSLDKEKYKEVAKYHSEINYKQFSKLESDNYAHCYTFYLYAPKEEESYKISINALTKEVWVKKPLSQASNHNNEKEGALGIPLAKPFCADNNGSVVTFYNGTQNIKTSI